MISFVFNISVMSLCSFLFVCAYYHFRQDVLIFNSRQIPKNYTFSYKEQFKELYLPVDNHQFINVLYFYKGTPKGVILYLHGAKTNLSNLRGDLSIFLDEGYDILAIDYRGFGKSYSNKHGFEESSILQDAMTAYNYLKKIFAEKDIVVYGTSLGSGIATWVASKNNPKMLILESAFYNMLEVACECGPKFMPRILMHYMLKFKFPQNEWIKNVKSPIYMIHGSDDKILPLCNARRLYEECKDFSDIEFIQVDGWGHEHISKNDYVREKIKLLLKK